MAKSIRSKREKRLRAIRREIVKKEPFYVSKEAAKLAAQEAALAAPKLPVKTSENDDSVSFIEDGVNSNATASASAAGANSMDMDTDEGDKSCLKPKGGIGKKMRKKIKIAKKKNRGKGKIRRKNI